MKPTHSIEAYIQEVQNNIRWKRARKIATQDLEQHIQDQFDAYVNQGMDSDPALEEAIKSMGDPQKIGKELDCAYRPKINILLIELTTAFLVLGVIIHYLLEGTLSKNNFIAIGIGCFAAVALYFFDYTFSASSSFSNLHSTPFFSACLFAFEARNGIHCIGYNYTFYTLLLFPISLSLVALYLKESNKTYGLILFTIFTIPPFLLSFLISSVPAIAIISTIYALIIFYGIKNNWFLLSIPCAFLTVAVFVVTLIILCFLFLFFNLKMPNLISYDSFFQQKINDSVSTAGFYMNNRGGDEIRIYAGTAGSAAIRKFHAHQENVYCACALSAIMCNGKNWV